MGTNANKNINHIECIEGLFSEINKHLGKITTVYPRERFALDQAIEEINLYQTTTLHDLRVLCEGD